MESNGRNERNASAKEAHESTNPNLFVQMPISPQSGIRTVTTLVITNIFFVLIFQYRWMYQKPSVLIRDVLVHRRKNRLKAKHLAVDVIACARPRYVF